MGQFDSLIPGNTAVAPSSAPNQFASLIPKATVSPIQPKGTLVGQTIAGLPAASGIPQAFSAGVQQMNQGAQQANTAGGNIIQRGEGLLSFGAGAVGAAFAPLAPITNLIGKAIDFAGQQLANVPAIQEFAKYSTPTDTRVLTDLQNLGGIAMGLLGAKAGDIKAADIPPAKLQELAQHPDVIAAAQKLGEAQKAVLPDAQAPLQKVVESTIPKGQFDHLVPEPIKYTPEGVPIKPTEAPVAPETAPKSEIAPQKAPTTLSEPTLLQRAKDYGAVPADATPETKVTIYRSASGAIKEGEHVTTSEGNANRYSPLRGDAPIQKAEVSVKDLTPTKGLGNEFLYTPAKEATVGRTTQTLKPIEGTGELKTRGAALSIEASAIEKGLTDNLGQLPEYKSVKFADMVPKIQETFANDPVGARAIAMGDKAAPKGTTPEMFAITLEKDATAKGDVATLQELANSKLTAAGTTMGQRIASYAQRDEHSATQAIKEVQAAREADLAKRGATIQKDATARISDSIKKTNTVKSWSDFVSSIEC